MSPVILFALVGIGLVVAVFSGAIAIQKKRRKRLRSQWRSAAERLGADFADDQLAGVEGAVRFRVSFRNAQVSAPGRGERRHNPMTVLVTHRQQQYQSTLSLTPEDVCADRRVGTGLDDQVWRLLGELYQLSFMRDIALNVRGHRAELSKLGWIDTSDDLVAFIKKGCSLVACLS